VQFDHRRRERLRLMHFHLPKPLHGSREFAGEVGIIVVGVLIALAAEQLVENWRWHERAQEARERLRAEVGHVFLLVEERRDVTKCIDKQLDNIEDAILASGAVMKRLPAYREAGLNLSYGDYAFVLRTPSRSWPDSAWQGAIAEGVSSHLTTDERRLLPIHYTQMMRASAFNAQDDAASGDLAALSKPLALDAGVKASFIRVIEQERLRNLAIGALSTQMMETIHELGYVPNSADRRAWLESSGTIKFCKSHGLPA
jgi:hypothetical protein